MDTQFLLIVIWILIIIGTVVILFIQKFSSHCIKCAYFCYDDSDLAKNLKTQHKCLNWHQDLLFIKNPKKFTCYLFKKRK